MDKEELKSIWEQVKKNHEALRMCPRPHEFEQIGEGVRREYKCKKCGGKIGAINHFWYQEGLEDGLKKRGE